MTNEDTLCNFEPADFNACGSEWHEYKRLFEIHLDANGRYGVDGREKVRQLLKCMGQQSTEIYNSFTWAAAIPAIPADEENDVEAQEEYLVKTNMICKQSLVNLMHILVHTSTKVSRGKLK